MENNNFKLIKLTSVHRKKIFNRDLQEQIIKSLRERDAEFLTAYERKLINKIYVRLSGIANQYGGGSGLVREFPFKIDQFLHFNKETKKHWSSAGHYVDVQKAFRNVSNYLKSQNFKIKLETVKDDLDKRCKDLTVVLHVLGIK